MAKLIVTNNDVCESADKKNHKQRESLISVKNELFSFFAKQSVYFSSIIISPHLKVRPLQVKVEESPLEDQHQSGYPKVHASL